MDEQKNNFCPDMPEQAGEPGSPDMEKQKAVLETEEPSAVPGAAEKKCAPEVEREAPQQPGQPLPPVVLCRDGLTAFGFCQQGESHLRRGDPCQDFGEVRFLQARPIVLAAVADGVGSCQFSHHGSAVAVCTALDTVAEELEPLAGQEGFQFTDNLRMKRVLTRAFENALAAVERTAEKMQQLPYSFQSTLTVAVYDGERLYFGHAGDDGIVALCRDGTCQMATTRHKGDSANSVIPLQGKQWQFGLVDREVAAFAVMTDGVLDPVVGSQLFKNRVYYPFFAPLFQVRAGDEAAEKALCQEMWDYMAGKDYRARVTDDLTLVTVTNQNTLPQTVQPIFDQAAWDKETEETVRSLDQSLYPAENPVSARPQEETTAAAESISDVAEAVEPPAEAVEPDVQRIFRAIQRCAPGGRSDLDPANAAELRKLLAELRRLCANGSIRVVSQVFYGVHTINTQVFRRVEQIIRDEETGRRNQKAHRTGP